MDILNFKPQKDEKWTLEQAKGYYLQQIAIQLEQLNDALKSIRKHSNFWQEINKRDTSKMYAQSIALNFMTMKQEVIELFAGVENMKLSELRNKVSKICIYGGEEMVDAINMTDYLEARKTGNGFRVWLIS